MHKDYITVTVKVLCAWLVVLVIIIIIIIMPINKNRATKNKDLHSTAARKGNIRLTDVFRFCTHV